MTQYSIELYDRNINMLGFSEVVESTIFYDYMTIEKSNISVIDNELDYKIDYFIKLINITENKIIYDGVISGVEQNNGIINLEVKSLLSIFDVTTKFDRLDLKKKSLENFIENIIINTFLNNEDKLQHIPIEVKINSIGIFNATLNLKDNIHNLYEIILKAFEKYNLIIREQLVSGKLIFSIEQTSEKSIFLDLDLPIVLDRYLKLQDNSNSINKITLIDRNDESQNETYYLLSDNTISTDINNPNRVYPAIFTYEYVDGDFDELKEQIANERLKKSKYNELIEIVILKENRIIDIDNLKIGQKVRLNTNNKIIDSIFTGYETMSNNTVKLIFGRLRIDLTKILQLERR